MSDVFLHNRLNSLHDIMIILIELFSPRYGFGGMGLDNENGSQYSSQTFSPAFGRRKVLI